MNAASSVRQLRLQLGGALRLHTSWSSLLIVMIAMVVCAFWYGARVHDPPDPDPLGLAEIFAASFFVAFIWLYLAQVSGRGRLGGKSYFVRPAVPTLPVSPLLRGLVDLLLGSALAVVLLGATWLLCVSTGNPAPPDSFIVVGVATIGIGSLVLRSAHRPREVDPEGPWEAFLAPACFSALVFVFGAGEPTSQALALAGLALIVAACLPWPRWGRPILRSARTSFELPLARTPLPPTRAIARDLWRGLWARETAKKTSVAIALHLAAVVGGVDALDWMIVSAIPILAGQAALGIPFRAVRVGRARESFGAAFQLLPVRRRDIARAVFVHTIAWGAIACALLASTTLLAAAWRDQNLGSLPLLLSFVAFVAWVVATIYVVVGFGPRWQHPVVWTAFGIAASFAPSALKHGLDALSALAIVGICTAVPLVFAAPHLLGLCDRSPSYR